MKILKIILRALIAIILIIPTAPVLWLVVTCVGLFLTIPLFGIIVLPYNWLLGDKEQVAENKEMAGSLFFMVIFPITFWLEFIKGNNPLKGI